MGAKTWFALPSRLAAADQELVEAFDRVIRDGERTAARHLACRIGCTACCIGPFDITALDAFRLRHGLEALALKEPEQARGIVLRAREQWNRMADCFPGDPAAGVIQGDDDERERFFRRFVDLPCPVLDPATGACLLYEARPLSCRSFGLPLRTGSEVLPPCALNFTRASVEEIAAAAVAPDPADLEGALLAEVAQLEGGTGDTVVCAAVAHT